MEFWIALEHVELHLTKRLASAHALFEVPIVAGHQLPRGVIGDRPETHDQRLGPGNYKGPPQSIDAFAVAHFTDARVTGGQDHLLRAPEIQTRSLEGGQNSSIVTVAIPKIGA